MGSGSGHSSQSINSSSQHIIGTQAKPENIAEPIRVLKFQLSTLIFLNGKFALEVIT